jgi:hypothetical protein
MTTSDDRSKWWSLIATVIIWLMFFYRISDWVGRENLGEVLARRSIGQLLVSPGFTILGLCIAIGMTVQHYRTHMRD